MNIPIIDINTAIESQCSRRIELKLHRSCINTLIFYNILISVLFQPLVK